MAHFAELDENNIVTRVIVVANKDTADVNGVEQEWIGQAFCVRLLGGNAYNWKQTSYNGNFRKNFAGIGFTYDPVLDIFIPPKPYPSWVFDSTTGSWTAPVVMPGDGAIYNWNEATQSWIKFQPPQQ